MSLKSIKKLSFKSQLPILAGMVLVFGLFAVVSGTQQRQDIRSRAAGYGGTGNCSTLNTSIDELVADDCTIPGGLNYGIRGNRNTIMGGLGGWPANIFGDDNLVMGGMNGTINGNGNEICGGLGGSINGNNNIIHGGMNGTDNGTGNKINFGGVCGTIRVTPTPTSVPIPTPTTRPFGTCKDGIDNNQNELIDGGDPVCHTDGNQNNPGSYDPYKNESIVAPTVYPTPPTGCVYGDPQNGGQPILICPTITVAPGNTSIKLNLFLHGLGQGGDAANPNSGGNANPLRPQRNVKLEVYNGQNQLEITKDGIINFNQSTGNFLGVVDLGGNLPTGVYTVKVKTDQFLKTLVPGIQKLIQGSTNLLPKTIMVNGDIDGNNQINILDYNILIGCYSDFLPAPSCTAANKPLSDLDDDGDVNQFDYNLFIRELTNIAGV